MGWWRRRRWDRWRWLILAGVVALAAVGVWRVESTARRAESAAAEAKAATARIEVTRVQRCVDGREDIRAAIVRVVDEFTDLPPARLDELAEVVRDEIPAAACTSTPP